jgi:hypothetical protein
VPIRLPLNLFASAVPPLHVSPRFKSELFLSPDKPWIQDVSYLRDTYNAVFSLWEDIGTGDSALDKELTDRTEPLLRELVTGMTDVANKVQGRRPDIVKASRLAKHNFDIANAYFNAEDYATCAIYQTYCISKIHQMLDSLTMEINRKRAMRKKAYGFDQSGEVGEIGGDGQKNIEDTVQPQDGHMTAPNPANTTRDVEAENDFPTLKKMKEKRVIWPPREV